MRRQRLAVWAEDGQSTDPDLDASHPSGEGGNNKYSRGWVVEKEPHQWANFIYQAQTVAQVSAAMGGVNTRGSLDYKVGALSWFDGEIGVLKGGRWHRSFASYSLKEATDLRNLWRANHDSHVARVDYPHKETPAQIGTIPAIGGTFTGEVWYKLGFKVGSATFGSARSGGGACAWTVDGLNGTGFLAGTRAVWQGTKNNSMLLLEAEIVDYERRYANLFVTPEPDGSWPMLTNPYSMTGMGSLEITGGNELPVFNRLGLLLESNKVYRLSDLSLLTTGMVIALVDGLPVVIETPQNTTDLKALFGAGKTICDIRVWGYKLTPEQRAAQLYSMT